MRKFMEWYLRLQKHRAYKKRIRVMAQVFEEFEREQEMWDPEYGNPVG